jgi:hypothetical protein
MMTREKFLTLTRRAANGCLLWTGSRFRNGYGRVFVGSRLDGSRRQLLAHRVAYELFVGPIPIGLTLDHVKARGCRYRHCVEWAHLEPVTQAENLRRGDGFAGKNFRKKRCKRGHLFTERNTMKRPGGRGCRKCFNMLVRDSNERFRKNQGRGREHRATHCRHGHPYDSENTYVSADGRWNCRACGRIVAERRRCALMASSASRFRSPA